MAIPGAGAAEATPQRRLAATVAGMQLRLANLRILARHIVIPNVKWTHPLRVIFVQAEL
jgi:hypothetical protein